MRKDLLKHGVRINTPQTEAIPGRSDMVENYAGGFGWEVDDWMLMRRFLVLGTEGGTYYANQCKITKSACEATLRCIKKDGVEVVKMVTELSSSGRAHKNDYALFVLAACLGAGGKRPTPEDIETRMAAFSAIPEVARIGTHLFHLVAYAETFRGWGKGYKHAIAKWYNDKDANSLAYQMAKYQSRDGWSHYDTLRLAHPNPNHSVSAQEGNGEVSPHEALYAWAVDKAEDKHHTVMPEIISAFEEAKKATKVPEIVKLIRVHNLPRECIPTQFLSEAKVWEALLNAGRGMPMTALIRNLGNLSKVGLLTEGHFTVIKKVCDQLTNPEALAKARIHPLSILAATITYGQGHGFRGRGTWGVVGDVMQALDSAFYLAFKNVEPTNKRIVIGLDVSGSMNSGLISGIPGLSPRMGACAMSMITYRTEAQVATMAFSDSFLDIQMSRYQRLDDLMQYTTGLPFAGTDCALPILWGEEQFNKNPDIVFDAFLIYTDNETWFGNEHPKQALDRYRDRVNPEARLVTIGMTSTEFSIADPTDSGMLDCVGMDTSTPNIISAFLKGEI